MKKTYALYAFSQSGRSNIIVVVRAETDEEAARKLGGKILVNPTINRVLAMFYCMRLPQLGDVCSQFQFGNESVEAEKAMKRLGEITGQHPAGQIGGVENLATWADHLIIARVPFLEE